MLAEQFVVRLTPLITAARVARHRRALGWRIGSAVISGAILVAIFYFADYEGTQGWFWLSMGLWLVSTALWIGFSAFALHRATRDLASISSGDALMIDAAGITFCHPERVVAGWQDISALKISGGSFGAGPSLVMEVNGQPAASIPMSFLDVMPSAIDSAVSARSVGRVRVDVSDMDRLL
ncbi:MAG: hypothetical protein ACK5KO_07405 [Arachnia sp.]